ncbi:MAG: HAD family hydrolase, partial [Myxococcales bacterium]
GAPRERPGASFFQMKPLRTLPASRARSIRAIFTDVDGTLTTSGKLLASTYQALWRWRQEGRVLVLVTGRSAGWAEAMARLWPVDAVAAENGGIAFVPQGERLERLYATAPAQLARDRARMFRAAKLVARRVPGAALSSDSRYTEVDLAIDYNEENRLGAEAAGEIERVLRSRGLHAVRSSVHVNFWAGDFDKLWMCRKLLARLGLDASEAVYVGDSVNDEPMFQGFPDSVGVANVRDVLPQLTHHPRWITRAREGRGFEELVRTLLSARATGRVRRR